MMCGVVVPEPVAESSAASDGFKRSTVAEAAMLAVKPWWPGWVSEDPFDIMLAMWC